MASQDTNCTWYTTIKPINMSIIRIYYGPQADLHARNTEHGLTLNYLESCPQAIRLPNKMFSETMITGQGPF